MDALHRGARHRSRRAKSHGHVNPTNDEDAVLGFHLAGDVRREPSAARIDVTRLQRASKGAEHSTGRGRDHVVDRGGVRFGEARRIDLVVLRDRAVHAERHGLRFARQVGDPQRSLEALDAHASTCTRRLT